jgi:hypothetical protein
MHYIYRGGNGATCSTTNCGNGGNGGIAVKGSANGQDGTTTSNGANGGISINGNLPVGCKVAQNGLCRLN